jgi:ABC-type polysaccharide/polyol phosphate export permease
MAIYPLRTMLGAAFHFGLGLVVVLAMTWCFRGIGPVAPLISLAPTLVLLLVLGWSLAILAGFANVMFPDMQHLLEVGLQLVFYATPIIYPPDLLRSRGAGWIVDFNPASALVDLVRQPILYGQFPSAMTMLIASGTCLAAATLATLTLARWQRRLVFYL